MMEEEKEEKMEEEEEVEEVEEENVLEDLENPSPSPPLKYPIEKISFEELFEIIINQLNFIYFLSALTIRQEEEEEEKKEKDKELNFYLSS